MSPATGNAPSPGSRGGPLAKLAGRLWRSPYLLLALAALFWSGNIIVGRAVHEAVPPVALAFWRWIGGLALLLGFAWPHLRRDLAVLRRHWRMVLLLAAFGITGFNTLLYVGLGSTTAINALLMQSAMPLVILLLSFILFGERAGPAQMLGIAASLAGVAVIVGRGSPGELLRLSLNPGDALVLTAVVSYALYSALLRKRPPVHPLSFIAATFAIGALLLLPLYAGEHLSGNVMRWSLPALLAIGYTALFPSVLAYACFNRGVELIGANRAGQALHLMPVFGSLLAIAFLGETLHGYHMAGIALIAAGLMLAAAARRRPGPGAGEASRPNH